MNISNKSWHYRLVKLCDFEILEKPNFGLCEYFWTVCQALFLCTILVSLLLFVLASLFIVPLDYFEVMEFNHVLVNISSLVLTIVGLFILCVGVSIIIGFSIHMYNSTKDKGKDNILTAYIKSKKEKFCPTINVINEED